MNTLANIEIGTIAIIKDIHCTGEIKRRLLDLGMVNGTKIKAVFRSPGNDPTAYEVRNALIALRKEDAENIIVEDIGGRISEDRSRLSDNRNPKLRIT